MSIEEQDFHDALPVPEWKLGTIGDNLSAYALMKNPSPLHSQYVLREFFYHCTDVGNNSVRTIDDLPSYEEMMQKDMLELITSINEKNHRRRLSGVEMMKVYIDAELNLLTPILQQYIPSELSEQPLLEIVYNGFLPDYLDKEVGAILGLMRLMDFCSDLTNQFEIY